MCSEKLWTAESRLDTTAKDSDRSSQLSFRSRFSTASCGLARVEPPRVTSHERVKPGNLTAPHNAATFLAGRKT